MESLDPHIRRDVQNLWNYHLLHHKLSPADLLFIPCSNDLRVADHAATLYHDGYAPLIVTSGGIAHTDDLLATGWDKPEAYVFASRLQELGVPREAILIEDTAQNCEENIKKSRALLEEKEISVRTLIVAQKPYMQRRIYATIKKVWPEVEVICTAPALSFEQYCDRHNPDDVINIMVGDLQRIIEYPNRGFQIEQAIPQDVMRAYEQLLSAGYTKHLIKI